MSFDSTVLIALHIEATADRLRAVPSHVSVDMISDPRTLVTHLTNAAGGTIPHIRRIEDKYGDLYISNNINGIRHKFHECVNGVQFLLLVPHLKKSFVGYLLQTTLHNSLQQCKQMYYDITTRKFVIVGADQFHENFIISMNTLSNVTQTDLLVLFYTDHCEEARLTMEAQPNFKLPGRPPSKSTTQACKRVAQVR